MTKDLKMTTVKDLMKVHNNKVDKKISYFWDIRFKVTTRIMTYNIIPKHVRFSEISCNVWNIYINIFPYKQPNESLVLVVLFVVFLYCRILLGINFIHISVYMSISIAQFSKPPQFSPLGVHMSVLYICVSTSALQTGSSVPFF